MQQKLLKENKDGLLTIFSYPQPIYINLFSLCPAITRRSSLANQIILSAKFSEIYFIGGICKKPYLYHNMADPELTMECEREAGQQTADWGFTGIGADPEHRFRQQNS